jgi:thiamine-phosphate diphosphorylase/hydroxyethylthiazole kinase
MIRYSTTRTIRSISRNHHHHQNYHRHVDYSLYLVTDSNLVAKQNRSLEQTVKQAIHSGVSIVQLREKDPVPNTREFIRRARTVLNICKQEQVPLIINDRVDVALAIDADGVHVGQEDMNSKLVRQLIGKDKILGVTVGTENQTREAIIDAKADYLGTNAIFNTLTKKDAGCPMGLEQLKQIVDYAKLIGNKPVVGIGGINETNIESILQQGASGAAVVSAIMSAPDVTVSTASLRRKVDYYLHSEQYSDLREKIVQALNAVRSQKPLIHNITNYVVMNQTANAILRVGGSPIMAHAHEEMDELSSIASALVLNPGTLDPYWVDSMCIAGETASRLKKPIILDPVGYGASRYRTNTFNQLLKTLDITILKGNAGEIGALYSSDLQGKVRGVDSTSELDDPNTVAKTVAKRYNCVVVITGPVDIVSDGERVVHIQHNQPILGSQITGSGCTVTAITGCFAAVTDPFVAACAGVAFMGVCADEAVLMSQKEGQGIIPPETFYEKLLDNFALVSSSTFRSRVQFKVVE